MNTNDTKGIQTQDGVVFSVINDESFEGIMVYNQNKMTREEALEKVKQWPLSAEGVCMLPKECFDKLFRVAHQKNPKYKYIVATTYSFDTELVTAVFDTEEEAVAYLRDSYETELNIDTTENGWDATGERSEDGWYAKITNHFSDHDDVTEFQVGSV